jgi:hypothetical protein
VSKDRSESQPSVFTSNLLGRTLGGRYRVTASLGKGGAGMVLLGIQEPLGREVAIKVLRSDLEGQAKTEFEARFLREAAVAGRLLHPNIVTVHDYGTTDDGLRYVVMERLTGPTLAGLVQNGGSLEAERAARLVADLGRGLAAAHDAGLVHRDVKPHNVIVQTEDGRERPVLLDFGLAKVKGNGPDTDSFQTRAGTYMGTPAYMAPEQAEGRELDHRADVYALGCVLYRLLTGTTPYDAQHPLGMAVQHMTQPYPPMRVRAPERDIPHALERIAERAMRKAPDDRYPTARAMVAELDAFLAGDPVVEAPPARGFAVGAGVGAIGAGLGVLAVLGASAGVVLLALGLWLLVPGEPLVEPEPSVLLTGPAPGPEPLPVPTPTAPAPITTEPTPPDPALPRPVAPSEPSPVERPRPVVPVPAPAARPAPTARPSGGSLVFDEVPFTPAQADRTLTFVNTATDAQLRDAGVYDKGVTIILTKRPFASMDAFAATYQIGTKTVEAVRDAAK